MHIQTALVLASLADLHHEFAVGGEDDALVVFPAAPGLFAFRIAAIAAHPNAVLSVQRDAMLLDRPVELGKFCFAHRKLAAPAAHKTAVWRQLDHRGRRHAG